MTGGLDGKRILFFAPNFFSYDLAIKQKLEELGASVDLYDERPSSNIFSKAVIRLKKNIIRRRIADYFDSIIKCNRDKNYDYIFIIKGEVFTPQIIKKMTSSFPNSTSILYLWDSVKNYPQTQECLELFDSAFTFDRNDSVHFPKLTFRPLFYIDKYAKIAQQSGSLINDLLFVGTAHTDRWVFLEKIRNQAAGLNLNSEFYIYFQSPLLYLFRKLFDRKRVGSLKIKDARFKKVSQDQVIEKVAHSSAVLDIQHPKQTGLTMRAIEVFGANRKLITTNSQVKDYDFYNPDNILVLDRESPQLESAFFEKKIVLPSDDLKFKYSLSGWVADIFELT